MEYRDNLTPEEVNRLRKAVGFRQNAPAQLREGLKGSRKVVAAYDRDRVVGMARLIWDGGGVALITDVLVVPEYQPQGLAGEMVTQILHFLRDRLQPGFGIQVDVRAWSGQEAQYAALGFQPSIRERRGLPMQICLTDQIEITDKLYKQCEYKE